MSNSTGIPDTDSASSRDELRARILNAAIQLLTEAGRDAVTTRAVAEAAGVQPPILYRLFRDKRGLLDAVAEYGFAAYLAQKEFRPASAHFLDNLRAGWDLHIEFGLANPALYLLMYAEPRPGTKSPAAEATYRLLRQHTRQLALAGHLRVSEERAAHLLHAAASGIVLLLLGTPSHERDESLSRLAREATLATITAETPVYTKSESGAAAIALRAALDETAPFSSGERALLTEWLDRLANQSTL